MKVGILGGGQLGRMLALSGYPLGLTFRFFDPNAESPAGQLGELHVGSYDDQNALSRFADGVDVATYEFESIPLAAVEFVAKATTMHPPARALAAAQDRLAERELLERVGVSVAPYAPVGSITEFPAAGAHVGFPALLKTRTLGYDGKGQSRIESAAGLEQAWQSLGSRPCILERVVEFARELSILAVRGTDGQMLAWPLVENYHSEGILRWSFAPADVSGEVQADAEAIVRRVAEAVDYVGVLAVELFDTADGLIANEIAPRVHNSGHWTIEGAQTSQFENHLRAILGLPLGATAVHDSCAMLNLIGSIPPLDQLLSVPDTHLHLYGKSAVHKRKLGHVTIRAHDRNAVKERAAQLRALLAR